MSDFDPWDRLDATRRAIYEKGEAAAQVLRKYETIERWHEIGDAAAALMDDVATYSGGNTSGKGYTRLWANLSAHVPTVRDLDKSARSAAVWMARNWDKNQDNANLPSITAWLATLAASERLTINHPTVVKRRYDAKHKAPPMLGKTPATLPRIALQDTTTRLQEELDMVRKRALDPDATPADALGVLGAIYGQGWMDQFYGELVRWLTAKPNDPDWEQMAPDATAMVVRMRKSRAESRKPEPEAEEAEADGHTDLLPRRRKRRRI